MSAAFALTIAVIGTIVLVFAIAGLIISVVEYFSGEFWTLIPAAIAAIVVGLSLWATIWGWVTYTAYQREQCEAAGYEWITDTCYGVNVNINGGVR
ncbi:membrane protein [Gordonia phage Dorito]|uniref:Membrane protein n=1 Tax=Gordonia phage Dorito TaxID=2499023 RepID=A0A3S9UAL0_9CAUD|nr:membrane protein [Gordonia phage Dorito]AZS07321.1 membrane protein [Gordonia phage Dorito]